METKTHSSGFIKAAGPVAASPVIRKPSEDVNRILSQVDDYLMDEKLCERSEFLMKARAIWSICSSHWTHTTDPKKREFFLVCVQFVRMTIFDFLRFSHLQIKWDKWTKKRDDVMTGLANGLQSYVLIFCAMGEYCDLFRASHLDEHGRCYICMLS
jgi:hypothetical protein